MEVLHQQIRIEMDEARNFLSHAQNGNYTLLKEESTTPTATTPG